jgi:hypothetical protein
MSRDELLHEAPDTIGRAGPFAPPPPAPPRRRPPAVATHLGAVLAGAALTELARAVLA